MPIHERGVVGAAPGLYFVGLHFQYAAVSDVLPGVGRDAEYMVRHIASRNSASRPMAATRHDGQDLARTSAI
jgi:putative flavoprotein involved in K+ transport